MKVSRSEHWAVLTTPFKKKSKGKGGADGGREYGTQERRCDRVCVCVLLSVVEECVCLVAIRAGINAAAGTARALRVIRVKRFEIFIIVGWFVHIFPCCGLEPTRVRWKDDQVCATSLCQDKKD